jgi:hypothetical protein
VAKLFQERFLLDFSNSLENLDGSYRKPFAKISINS